MSSFTNTLPWNSKILPHALLTFSQDPAPAPTCDPSSFFLLLTSWHIMLLLFHLISWFEMPRVLSPHLCMDYLLSLKGLKETTFDLIFAPRDLKSDWHIVKCSVHVCWIECTLYLADKWVFLRYQFILTFPFSNPWTKSFFFFLFNWFQDLILHIFSIWVLNKTSDRKKHFQWILITFFYHIFKTQTI